MRQPVYKSRPVAPNPARFGDCERINDFIVRSAGFSDCFLIETREGNVQINAGMGIESPVVASNLESLAGENSGQATTHLILTQGHVDHVGGVAFFRERHPGLQVIAGAENAEHQAYDARLAPYRAQRSAFAFTDKFIKAFEHYAEHGLTEFPEQDSPRPDILVDERHAFEVGGIKIEVICVAGAETNDSVIVWLPEHRICFTGNLFGCPFGHFPNLVTIRGDRYRDPLVVANAVQTVKALNPELICYGHHGPVEGAELIQQELDALHGAIMHVHDEVVDGMNSGKSLDELMRTVSLPKALEVGEGYGKVSWGVRAIWELYSGWFHHRSTTELFPGDRSTVSDELYTLAGGEQPLLERAGELTQQGELQKALHLLDIIRQAGGASKKTNALYIEIHETLLAKSSNFWLSAWLSNQIKLANDG